ncbi:MAG TPA: SPFH domain-containing protein [Candidatus Faeciplasma avium]|uniref:SPFH domain-containing protein n=1 Tax=Candidatus Faeciplasma avium TaxID=2840798 RepID=A0A9D1T3X5_9FIRM|nr:SPFH domain-containing protein [Candidatus Faeciplasma avium]
MGLIKAVIGAVGSSLADTWKEYFVCDSMDDEILAVKGKKVVSGRSSNTRGSDNIITNGSGVVVADGQCMMIIDNGKVVEICAEPGRFTYDSSSEPSIFTGSLGDGILDTLKTIGRRITYGGDTGSDQRVYYFNTKEIMDNKFGTASPVPFRVVDSNIGLDIDVSLRCNGVYSYKIADPLKFYANVCGNFTGEFQRSEIASQLKTELVSALQPAFGRLSELEIRPNQVVTHTAELEKALSELLTEKWTRARGIELVSISLGSITLPDEDAKLIRNAQQAAIMRDPSMAAAQLAGAQADAMRKAAENSAGAMTGFMGMGMAMNQGGASVEGLFAMADKKQSKAKSEGWKCVCGSMATGNFCPECGRKRSDGWVCSCGTANKGNFCTSCGSKRPAGEPLYRCDKCGWEPDDPKNPPKFCPECGDRFDDSDIK